MPSAHLTCSRPSEVLTHVRNMIEPAAAGDNAQCKILKFSKALYAILRAVAVHRKAVSDVREDQGIGCDIQ